MTGAERAGILLLAFALDLLLGDPPWLPHPVVGMGRVITWAEPRLRRAFPKTDRGEFAAGLALALGLPALAFVLSGTALALVGRVHPALRLALEIFWCYQALAVRDMVRESGTVYRALLANSPQSKPAETARSRSARDAMADTSPDGMRGTPEDAAVDPSLDEARRAVGRIVGRDTASLDRTGIAAAAVESVAESFHDGVVAPLLYMALGGAPLALCGKAVNTLDSMIGYRNTRYRYFGRAAARLDDAVNFLPARLGALLLTAAAFFAGENGARAYLVWRRDRRKHASPNSAQTESAMAGALGIRLGGGAYYGGQFHARPFLNESGRVPEAADILRANRVFLTASVLGAALFAGGLALWGVFFP